ncbi:unnamed protein product [Lupinus luteus]|uniref:Uncharacterized protein n=1 Tax=Lupinus luteus TaxID=3873 RepID=A0AAV1YM57_LUPLU
MDRQKPNNTPDGSGDVPLKRRRGRPRKYPRPDSEDSSRMLFGQTKEPNPGSSEQTKLRPGYEGVNGNQQLQRDQENGSNDAVVGQEVSGVIEAVFDAGYLLNVRVGDSDFTFRGLAFKPGHYVPISPENDVAPGVPVIQRIEVPFPSGTRQVQSPLPNDRNEHHVNVHRNETLTLNGSPIVPQIPRGPVSPINLVATSGKNAPSSVGETTHQLPRGNMVPVLLQPDNFSNRVPISNQPSQAITQISLGSGAIVGKEIPVGGNQAINSHTQTSHNMLSSGMPSKGFANYQPSSKVLNRDGANSMRVSSLPLEHLVTEIVKRVQPPSVAVDTETENSKSGEKMPVKDPSSGQEDKANDIARPVLINPLQGVQPHSHVNSAPAPTMSDYTKTMSDYTKTGKMTELLQILQDSSIEIQASKAAPELGSGNKLDDVRNLGNEH